MILDRLKNKREFSIKNISFVKENYRTIGIIPYSQKIIRGGLQGKRVWDTRYADSIYETCSNELTKLKYNVIDKDEIVDYIDAHSIDIVDGDLALDLDKLKQNENVHHLADGLGADAILAIDVKYLTPGFWYTANVTELDVFLFDGKTEDLIWRGHSRIIHGWEKNYRAKIFKIVFRELFKDLKE